jgi:hypothetical protein
MITVRGVDVRALDAAHTATGGGDGRDYHHRHRSAGNRSYLVTGGPP